MPAADLCAGSTGSLRRLAAVVVLLLLAPLCQPIVLASDLDSTVPPSALPKCCPHGLVYDLTERQCTAEAFGQTLVSDAFAQLGIGPAVAAALSVRVPQCAQSDEVFVEYLSESHSLRLHNNGLTVDSLQHSESEYLAWGTFCVEAAVRTTTRSINDDGSDALISVDNEEWLAEDTTTVVAVTEATEMPEIGAGLIVRTCRPRSICERIVCVRRCCRNDQMLSRLENGSTVCNEYERNIKPTFHEVQLPLADDKPQSEVDVAEYGLIETQTCKRYILDAAYPEDVHYIDHLNGHLHIAVLPEAYGPEHYCVEYVNTSGLIKYETFVCFREYKQPKFTYYAVGLTISSVFLWLTLIVYVSLPKLLNLHGKTLVCHVCSLLIGYTALSLAQFHRESHLESCYIVGYVIYFGFVASFCWQSIMCFDIWWTFGSMRMSRGMQKHKELRRFLLYSLYAWGVPILLTTTTILFDYHKWLPHEWSPNIIQDNYCWFQNDGTVKFAQLVFFLLPIGLHILTNSVLFALTARHCSKVKGEIHRMQALSDQENTRQAKRKFLADRTKYTMNMKLFIVMGVSWMLELIATVYRQNSIVWYFSDTFNILQGVLVFLIFVFKWKVWHAIRQRLGFRPASGKGATNATATTNLTVGSNARLDATGVQRKSQPLGKSVSSSTLASSSINLAATKVRKDC